jgi:hypothetical protein
MCVAIVDCRQLAVPRPTARHRTQVGAFEILADEQVAAGAADLCGSARAPPSAATPCVAAASRNAGRRAATAYRAAACPTRRAIASSAG